MPLPAPASRAEAVARWRRYTTYLDQALRYWVPRLLQPPSSGDRGDREFAAAALGQCAPHPGFLPLLRRVAENKEENQAVRMQALESICRTPHDTLVEYLVDQLDADLAPQVREQLKKLTLPQVPEDRAEWEAAKQR